MLRRNINCLRLSTSDVNFNIRFALFDYCQLSLKLHFNMYLFNTHLCTALWFAQTQCAKTLAIVGWLQPLILLIWCISFLRWAVGIRCHQACPVYHRFLQSEVFPWSSLLGMLKIAQLWLLARLRVPQCRQQKVLEWVASKCKSANAMHSWRLWTSIAFVTDTHIECVSAQVHTDLAPLHNQNRNSSSKDWCPH